MKYALWLANISQMSRTKKMALYEEKITAKEFYGFDKRAMEQLPFLSKELIEIVEHSKKSWNLEEEVYKLQKEGIGFVSREQTQFPEKLKHIPTAPYSFYYKGNLPDEKKKSIGMVGARSRSEYGRQVSFALAKKLSEQKVQIISGLARGIDGDCHRGAIEGETPTFAVLGCGVKVCYPKSNQYLYDAILASGGGILSEYIPKQQPQAYLFPQRNRIISGLSDALIVVEARRNSGSLITADFAMDQGKDVYAIPGRIHDSLSQGCNRLIEQGAGMIYDLDEFVRDICEISSENRLPPDFPKNVLEKDEGMLYSLFDFRPIGIATLMEESGMEISVLLNVLGRLVEKGYIKESFPNYYVRQL